MVAIESVLDAYLDLNVMLALVLAVWFLVRFGFRLAGMQHAYLGQSRVLKCAFLSVLLSPFVAMLYGALSTRGVLPFHGGLNVSDILVAQYLQGRIEMAPSAMETLLGARQRFVEDMVALKGWGTAVILGLAITGFALAVWRLSIGLLRLRRVFAEGYVWHRSGSVTLLISDRFGMPFSSRLLRRRYVIIPSAMLGSGRDLTYALEHEFQHLRQGDVEWELVLELLRPLFFWNPAFHVWKKQFEHLRELTCDQQVLARRRHDVADYCHCLLRVCASARRPRRLWAVDMPQVAMVPALRARTGRKSVAALRRRLQVLAELRPGRNRRGVAAVFSAMLVLVMVTATVAIQKPGDWSHDRLMLSTIVNLERLAARNGGSAPSFGQRP